MDLLKGKSGIVTGARSGIGAAIARRLAAEGATVGLISRNEAGLKRAAASIKNGKAVVLPCDISDEAAVCDRVGLFLKKARKIDFAVNAAGAFHLAPATETSVEDWDRLMGVNLKGAFLVSKAVLPHMAARGKGDIIHIGSVAGEKPFPLNAAYAASKFGLTGLVQVLAEEAAPSGVKVSLINPGGVDTPLWDDILKSGVLDPPPDRRAMLKPNDIAEMCLWLLTAPRRVHLQRQSVSPFSGPQRAR